MVYLMWQETCYRILVSKPRLSNSIFLSMNKLINTYLSSMDFFVNFNIDENFNETIKSDFVMYSHMQTFLKVRRCVLTLHYFLHGEVAKMKTQRNTEILLILDEIFDSSLDATGTDDFEDSEYLDKEERIHHFKQTGYAD